MPVILKAILAHADVTNANGRRYPLEVLKRAAAEVMRVDSRPLLVTNENEGENPSLANMVGLASDIAVQGTKLTAIVSLLDSPAARRVQGILSGVTTPISLNMVGMVQVDNANVAKDLTLLGVHMDLDRLMRHSNLRKVLMAKLRRKLSLG